MTQSQKLLSKKFFKTAFIVTAASFTLSACGDNLKETFGYSKNAPDEFAVITKSPLILPPDYSLRPPNKLASGPREANPREQVRDLLLGEKESQPTNVAGIEKSLLEKAGALNADDSIRATIEQDGKTTIRKKGNFVEELLFGDDAATADVIDPEAEAERLEKNKQDGKKPNEGQSDLISGEWSVLDKNLGD